MSAETTHPAHFSIVHLFGDLLQSLCRLGFVSGLLDSTVDEDVDRLGHVFDRPVHLRRKDNVSLVG